MQNNVSLHKVINMIENTPKPQWLIRPITQSAEALRSELQHPELFASKIEHLKPESRRLLEILATRVALKELFGYEQEVLYTNDGRPYLYGDSNNWRDEKWRLDGTSADDKKTYISISHTHGFVAVASCQNPIGIDIEQRGNRVEKVVSHFLQNCEIDYLKQTQIDYQLSLHLCWSAKESLFKILGKEYYDLQNLTTLTAIDLEKRIMSFEVAHKHSPYLVHYQFAESYVFTWVCELKPDI